MRRSTSVPLLLMAITGFSFSFASTVSASLIWSGAPSGGTGVFKLLNLEDASKTSQPNPTPNGSSVTTATDPTYGTAWQFSKASADLRAEAHGANGFNPAIGGTYFLGWRFKVNSTVTDNAVFQWKAYGSPLEQNFPLVIKFINGSLQFHYFSTGTVDHLLWSQPEAANQWNSIVLAIHVENDDTGFVNYWFNGSQQNLASQGATYNCDTFDGTSVDPKWGIYGAVGTQVTDEVAALKIGTTYNDVAPLAAPEPASLLAFSFGTTLLLTRRRR